jgi:hypothetical protein
MIDRSLIFKYILLRGGGKKEFFFSRLFLSGGNGVVNEICIVY